MVKLKAHWQPIALVGITLLGFALRLYGLNWDDGNSFHPDERQILFHVTALAWPTSLGQFLDPINSPLNPHFFAYGSFPLYLLAIVGDILAHFSPVLGDFQHLTLVGRVLSGLFDSGTILLTGWLALLLVQDQTGERRYAWNAALLAAGLVAFTPLELQLSHFYAVDTMLVFFVTLTVLACVALAKTDAPVRWSIVAGVGYGLAVATKFSAAPLAVPLIVALLLRWYKRDFFAAFWPLLLTSLMTLLSFLMAMPYAFLDWDNFKAQISDQGSLARGLVDLPYVRQFAGTTPYLYEAQNMFLWGMGVMLGLAALAGLLWLLWLVWKRNAGLWLIVISWVLIYGGITGSFYVKFMRYMLPIYPFLTLMAAALLLNLTRLEVSERIGYWKLILRFFPPFAIVLVLAGTMFQGLALLNVYSQPNTRVQASRWIYQHIPQGSVFTYEQWDDPLPVSTDGNNPYIYPQLTYPGSNGQPETGLDLYGDDTLAKANQLANLLPTVDVLTMATDRLDKSIPRLPTRYPLTIHYYQLLFSGQLGFHLVKQFENHPNLFGITLDDSNADESYSVFDHPTVRIFKRDNPYPYTSDQLYHKLLEGIQLPPSGAGLSGIQHSLILSSQQIADDQQSPPFGVQFPVDSLANKLPILFWWFVLLLLGLLAYPLLFPAFRSLRDRGYIFSKLLGLLFTAYLAWLLASLHLIAFSHLSILLVVCLLLVGAGITLFLQFRTISTFFRQRWRLLLLEEGIFTLAFLLFVAIRSLNPDLWHDYLGGEKPMELAFLNAILRSPYMPPLDPWFSGGYINYYYYGYVIIGSLIKLTGIVPTTAFNLAIPTLFAFTFTGVVAIIYNLTQRFSLALLGGYFAALIGNFDGLLQIKNQVVALLSHTPVLPYDYWQSSRIIPFTINEFPYWSFLFADLHPHVIDMPIAVLMLGLAATLLLSHRQENASLFSWRIERGLLYVLAAFVFGTIACVNTWDMPVYALVLVTVLMLQKILEKTGESKAERLISLSFHLIMAAFLLGLGYLFYWPFYTWYQQLYVNGLGLVTQGTAMPPYLIVFGFWVFLAGSFLLLQLYRWWSARRSKQAKPAPDAWDKLIYILLCGAILFGAGLLGVKALLGTLVGLGLFLCIVWGLWKVQSTRTEQSEPVVVNVSAMLQSATTLRFAYLLLILGLCITLGQEIVYVRDFLDGGDYERMNTVFKFSIQAWLCFAIGGALAVQHLWDLFGSVIRRIWSVVFLLLVLSCSLFLTEGTAARIHDHQLWLDSLPATSTVSDYVPTLDGFAFASTFYPGDAKAIAWLNANVAGSPVILEAVAPVSYQWYNRVSVYTGLPDVIGWPDHVGEQRYDYQPLNRVTDIELTYTTPDIAQALVLLRYYHVRYIYVGPLEQQLYGQQSSVGLDKFDHMVGSYLRIVYRSAGVTIYEML